jgi:class 3 adenylate cyclase/tetratricopeptide (TPR) repeat protein
VSNEQNDPVDEPATPNTSGAAGELVPFVPRLTIEWLSNHPERLWVDREGTLAFVDISGFTAMSERLSAFGRAGAEEVTDVMNATFAALLDVAYAYGGGLLKFGGDALLLLYDEPGHAMRAAAAAAGMRDALAAIARPQTSAGQVELRMHVGMHTGRFLFFLVGDSHRELLVAGPAATRTVEMEATSEAGDILLSPETAAALPAECLGEQKGAGTLLLRAPDIEAGLVPLPQPVPISLEHAIPRPLRAQLLEVGRFEGEHRNVAIGFVRFSGLDDLLLSGGADAAAAALDEIVRSIQQAADEHRVTFLETDIDRGGGRIVLVSGAPQTAGDDEERLLRTLRHALDANRALPLHIGASRGRAFTGQVGAEFRRTYTVLGDTAALSARLMARAEPDQLLAAAAVFDRAGGRFAATPLEPFHVKGKAEPVQAYAIAGLADAPAEAPKRPQLPFVDRERERAVLNAAVAPVRLGFGSLVELVGEPGLGKSRLTEELRSYCDDWPMLTARCEQYESTTPYHPFRPLLRSLLSVELDGDSIGNRTALAERLEEIDPELTPWSPLLGTALDVEMESTPEVDELEPSFRRARLHGVLGSLLGTLVDEPTFFLFEDVHWMDEASSELLRFLATQLSSRPWLACATRRPGPGGFSATEGVPPVPALTLRLEPLPAADARKLVEAAAGDSGLSDEELLALTERGAGNPLFLQELAAAGAGGDDADALPETVEALLATRIDGLAPGDRTLLRWASVMGASFHSSDVAGVLTDDAAVTLSDETWDHLSEFVERDPGVAGGFRFRHVLIRDAAYEGLSYRRRRELHGRVAEMLEARNAEDPSDVAELLSLHYGRAGRAPETWHYSREAGDRARGKWANREAVELYRRALVVVADVPDLAPAAVLEVWEEVAECLRLQSEFADAAQALAAARELAPDGGPEAVRLMGKEGLLHEDWGRYAEAIQWYNRGLEAADALADPDLRLRYRLDLGMGHAQTSFRQGRFQECIARCREVVSEALPAGDTKTLAPAYLLLHTVHTMLGSPERESYRGLALPLYEELGDLSGQASTLNNLGIEAYYGGDWPKALDLYERSRTLRERIGDVVSAAIANNNIGEILSDQGRLDEARELFEAVVVSCEQAGQRWLATLGRANIGYLEARAGKLAEAAELLREAVSSFTELDATSFVLETKVRLAEVAALQGDGAAALALADEVIADAGDGAGLVALQSSVHRIRATALYQLGDADGAGREVDESISIARAGDASLQLALALDLLALIDDDRDAAAESADLLRQLDVDLVARPPLRS